MMGYTSLRITEETHKKIKKVKGWRQYNRAENISVDTVLAEVFNEELDRIEIEKSEAVQEIAKGIAIGKGADKLVEMIEEKKRASYTDYPAAECKLEKSIQLAILTSKKCPCDDCNLDRSECGGWPKEGS